MSLNGIDISNWQSDIDLQRVPSDFVICKATEGTGFKDPTFDRFMKTLIGMGKRAGAYHFARVGNPEEQAAAFVDAVRPYLGNITLWLDWENQEIAGEVVIDQGPSWAKRWLDKVFELTGTRPGIYTSKNVANSYDWTAVKKAGYPLWGAQYADYNTVWGYDSDPWESNQPWGAWVDCLIHQYTGAGRLDGYGGNLDLDILWGGTRDWDDLIGGSELPKPSEKQYVTIDCANVAATLHALMCDDDAHFGYSWDPRYGGDIVGSAVVIIGGYEYEIPYGSWDCSSSITWCWRQALRYTPFEGALDGATYTGNMRSVFKASGLFEVWDTQSTSAVRGDVYLNDATHTAMCQDGGSDGVYGYDALSEFCINENGQVYSGKPGDQTGREAYVHGFYGTWECTLHYNHKADTLTDQEVVPSTPSAGDIRYRVSSDPTGRNWYDEMNGAVDTGGSGDDFAGAYGSPMRWFACDAPRYRVYSQANGWLPWVTEYNIGDLEYGCAGDGSPILLVEVPDANVWYAVHETDGDGWLPWMVGNRDQGGSADTFAGDDSPIDAIRMRRN